MKAFHFFVSHGLGWATADTLEAAMQKAFCTTAYGDLNKWLKNIQKNGEAGIPCFTCRVPLPEDANYSIDWFVPKVEGLTERANLIVTFRNAKTVSWMRDPSDEIRELKHQIKVMEDAA